MQAVLTVLLTTDGATLKQALNSRPVGASNVRMRMLWTAPDPDNIARMQLWTSSNDPASRQFKKTFHRAVGTRAIYQMLQLSPFHVVCIARVSESMALHISCCMRALLVACDIECC